MSDVVREFIEAHKGKRMSELWSPLLGVLWQDATSEVQSELEGLSMYDLVGVVASCEAGNNPGLTASQFETVKRIISASRDRHVDPVAQIRWLRDRVDPLTSIIKNPTKTNPYEYASTHYLRINLELETFPLVAQASSIGIQLRFSADGTVKIGSGRASGYSKSVDLLVIALSGGMVTVFLISHKFARVAGGHQDNQLNDVEEFLRNIEIAMLRPEIVRQIIESLRVKSALLSDLLSGEGIEIRAGAILDGEYFEGRNVSHGPKSFVLNTDRAAHWLMTEFRL